MVKIGIISVTALFVAALAVVGKTTDVMHLIYPPGRKTRRRPEVM